MLSIVNDKSWWLGYVGTLYVSYKLFSLLKFVYSLAKCHLTAPVKFDKYGKYAVITGSTDGIGKSFALHLAKYGMNIISISRTQSKLDDVVKEIQDVNPKIDVVSIQADFSDTGIYEKLKEKLEKYDIGMLVNNVGIGYDFPDYLSNLSGELLTNLLNVNCISMVQMCNIVLPQFVKKNGGYILNVSSGSAIVPAALLSVYAATKSFVIKFSGDLRLEYAYKNVTVQAVVPFMVATKMSGIKRTSFFVPSPTLYVKQAMNTLGKTDLTYGAISHEIEAFGLSLLPEWLTAKLSFREMKSIRERALKKRAKTQ